MYWLIKELKETSSWPWNGPRLSVIALAIGALEAWVAGVNEEAGGWVKALAAGGESALGLTTRAVLAGGTSLVADSSVGSLLGEGAEVNGGLVIGGGQLQQAHSGDEGGGEDGRELHRCWKGGAAACRVNLGVRVLLPRRRGC
jgi:hypothetical protein